MRYQNLWNRLVGCPLMITPEKAHTLLSVLTARQGVTVDMTGAVDFENIDLAAGSGHAQSGHVLSDMSAGGVAEICDVIDGIAVIPVEGTLVARNGLHPSSGMTGYDGIREKLIAAHEDTSIKGVALHINSPGGEVHGCFELADDIYAVGLDKPVWAILDEMSASAAYALASQCHTITVPRTGLAGSIGVVMMHTDLSELLKSDGVKITMIHGGAHKIDGNMYQPLPETVRTEIQKRVETVRALFAETVGRGRPSLGTRGALDTEAQVFYGADAVAANLADRVLSPADALSEFVNFLETDGRALSSAVIQSTTTTKELTMKHHASSLRGLRAADSQPENPNEIDPENKNEDKNEDETSADKDQPQKTADSDAEKDNKDNENTTATKDGKKDQPETAEAALKRAQSILALPSAQSKAALANKLAFRPGMSVADADELLTAAGADQSTGLAAAMNNAGAVDVDGGGDVPASLTGDDAVAANIIHSYNKATGQTPPR